MSVGKYRKKPVVIEAIRFVGTGKSSAEVSKFLDNYNSEWCQWRDNPLDGGFIRTLEGKMEFGPGDWIVKGIKGEFYPVKDDIFEATYEQVAGWPPEEPCDGGSL